ncbi:Mitochondrial import inner membrane translocase [uncultured Gammaproteobacteria bacterium]
MDAIAGDGCGAMGEGCKLVDIVFFAALAGFLVYRLYGVLGHRSGTERQRPNPYGPIRSDQEPPDNVIHLPDRGQRAAAKSEDEEAPYSLEAGINRIKAADPSFDEKPFLAGARAAFEMIVAAFARGDADALRPLLSDDVYDNFATAINDRAAAAETLETTLSRIKEVDLLEARMDGHIALVTLKFLSDQINVTRNLQGTVIDGDARHPIEVTDIWTFARSTRAGDPNWTLIETRTPN